jgi:flagellar basal-body rod protein FlgF
MEINHGARLARHRRNKGIAMDNILMAGLSRQIALLRQVDAMANNIANAGTNGYKAEFILETPITRAPARSNIGPRDVVFDSANTLLRDFAQGAMTQTGRELDVALEGKGFFSVQTDKGVFYTRDGAFALDPSGKLVTKSGDAVMSDANAEILIPTDAKIVKIAKIGVFEFEDEQKLLPMGGNLISANGQAAGPSTTRVMQGAIEGSNVQPVLQMTQLLQASRNYEALTRAMRAGEDLRTRAIQKLSGIQ